MIDFSDCSIDGARVGQFEAILASKTVMYYDEKKEMFVGFFVNPGDPTAGHISSATKANLNFELHPQIRKYCIKYNKYYKIFITLQNMDR